MAPGRRSRLLAAGAAAAAAIGMARATTPTPTPIASIGENTQTVPAYNYTIDPFHCDVPSVSVSMNASFTVIKLTYYNEEPQDALGLYPNDRTTFTFATFNSNLAQQPLVWDPSYPNTGSNPYNPAMSAIFSTDGPFSSNALLGAHGDTSLYAGLCDPAASSSRFTHASDLTTPLETTDVNLAQGLYTPAFTSYTAQTLGCACAAFGMDKNGVVYPVADEHTSGANYVCQTPSAATSNGHTENGDDSRLYWTSNVATAGFTGAANWNSTYFTRGWAIRQTTCQSNSAAGVCSASGSYKFAPLTITSQNACGLRTEAVWVQPTPQLQNLPSAIAYSGTTGVATFNLWTVEVGSTSNNVEGNVDSFQTRVLPHPFQVQQSKYGSVVIPIDAGDTLPPLISRVTDTYAYRSDSDANTGYVQFMLQVYVRQPNTIGPGQVSGSFSTSAGWAVTDTSATPTLELSPGDMDALQATAVASGDAFTLACDNFSIGSAGSAPTTGNEIACHYTGCGLLDQSRLPTFVTQTFSPGQSGQNYYWMPYDVTVKCTISTTGLSTSSAMNVPNTQVTIPYVLVTSNTLTPVTDLADKPTVTFSGYFDIPGTVTSQVTFPIVADVIQLSEASIASDATLTDVINDNLDNSVLTNHAFAYSEALAFDVQLQNAADQAQWQVRPALALLAAFSTAGNVVASTTTPTYQPFSASDQLDTNWCNLNSANLEAAFVFEDNGGLDGLVVPSVTTSGGVSTFSSLGAFSNMQAGLTTNLNNLLAGLVANNAYNNVTVFQGDIYNSDSVSTGQNRVFSVTDRTGGFAIPMRNRLTVNGQAGTYAISFCALTEVLPYDPMVRAGWYPVYPTAAAALADSRPVNGALPDPIALYGADFAADGAMPAAAAGIKFYLPVKPASNNGGVVCVPPSMVAAAKLSVAGITIVANNVAPCASLISAVTQPYAGARRLSSRRLLSGGRRQMLAVSTDLVAPNTNTVTLTTYGVQPVTVQFAEETVVGAPVLPYTAPTPTASPSPTATPYVAPVPTPTSQFSNGCFNGTTFVVNNTFTGNLNGTSCNPPPPAPPGAASPTPSSTLSPGAITGIVIGSVAGVGIVAAGVTAYVHRASTGARRMRR